MKVVDPDLLARMKAESAQAPRRRTHHNLHEDLADPIQRVVIALQPGTYVRPHRHVDGVWELFVLIEGACSVLIFTSEGALIERADLSETGARMAQVPPGAWHSVVCMQPGTVALESKPGPYVQSTDKNFAAWAPAEGEAGAPAMAAWMETAKVGDRA